ncbi:hypothetical protein JHK82_044796 [Glycine max]|nr:hypothetical protein JHK82_044796 [Glycine max]
MRLDILISYSYSEFEDRDLYVTGDLYENDVVTPAMIIVPRRSVPPSCPYKKGHSSSDV